MDPLSPDQTNWSISREEWDCIAPGQVRASASATGGLFVWIAALTTLISVGWALTTGNVWLIAAVALISGALLALSVRISRQLRRSLGDWAGMHPVVWEARGCVCPWCQMRVDREPCVGHGFSAADQPALLAYWEALASRDSSAVMQATDELQEASRVTTSATRAGLARNRLVHAVAPGMFDAERSPFARACAAWPVSLALLALLVLAAVIVDADDGRRTAMNILGGCWFVTLVPMAIAISWRGWKPGPLRCTACGHLCATKKPATCPECGANLAARGAIERGAKARSVPWAFLPLIALMWIMPSVVSRIVDAMPIKARNAIYSVTLPPSDYFRDLDLTTMSAAEATSTAELLIDLIARGDPPVFGREFIPKAIAAGKVPPTYREKSLRASARIEIAPVIGAGRRVTLALEASWSAPLWGPGWRPEVHTGGFSVDGGRSWIRQSSFVLDAGTHEILARAWIIVGASEDPAHPILFDERAAPILPDPSMEAFEVVLRTTVQVP